VFYYRVTIKTPILNININEIENIKEFCIQENMGFAPDYRITRTISSNSKPLQYKADWDSIEELSKKGIIKISNEYKWLASRSKIKISASGEIYPCEILPISLGNIRDKKFNEIINSEKANFIRKSISEERNECIKCEANGKCTFCLDASFLENGDINKISNDYCEISKKMVNFYNEEEKKW
jgi:radical SAM protein with 4Fe4S-binding SPASM domain